MTAAGGNALVLEGGGMRCAFTSGVLQVLAEAALPFSRVIGVSAGASAGASFVSGQPERNRKIFVEWPSLYPYFGFRHLFQTGGFLDSDLLFDTIPNRILPFDYERFFSSGISFAAGVTDCRRGRPLYLAPSRDDGEGDLNRILLASNTLPLISRPVRLQGEVLCDGGLSDSIPVLRALELGSRRVLAVLSRPRSYRKAPSRLAPLITLRHPRFPAMARAMKTRHGRYNRTLTEIARREAQGELFVIAPRTTGGAGRTERSREVLEQLYQHGQEEARQRLPDLADFLDRP